MFLDWDAFPYTVKAKKSPLSSDVCSTYEEFRSKKANGTQGHMHTVGGKREL